MKSKDQFDDEAEKMARQAIEDLSPSRKLPFGALLCEKVDVLLNTIPLAELLRNEARMKKLSQLIWDSRYVNDHCEDSSASRLK